jgi:hypothetical protein
VTKPIPSAHRLLKRADELFSHFLRTSQEEDTLLTRWRTDLLTYLEANPSESVRAVRAHLHGEDLPLGTRQEIQRRAKARLTGLSISEKDAGAALALFELANWIDEHSA